jgi:hypothetical protein
MNRQTRQRVKILLVIFCLLFQQVALAAYLCPLERVGAPTSAMVEHCAEMGMQQDPGNPALCQKHCAPDVLVVADHASPTVPALALAPPMHGLVLAQPISHVTVQAEVLFAPSGPPPRLRFCSLLL